MDEYSVHGRMVELFEGWNKKTSIDFTWDVIVKDIPKTRTLAQVRYFISSKYAYFEIDIKLLKLPDYLIESVIWHEYCHVWATQETGKYCGHGKEFKNRQKTVLRYWLGDYITKFVWGLC